MLLKFSVCNPNSSVAFDTKATIFWKLFSDNPLRRYRRNLLNVMIRTLLAVGGGRPPSMLQPTLQFPHLTHNDVPSGLFSQWNASFEALPPFAFTEDDVVVQLTVDDQGRVVDSLYAAASFGHEDVAALLLEKG